MPKFNRFVELQPHVYDKLNIFLAFTGSYTLFEAKLAQGIPWSFKKTYRREDR